MHAIRGVIVSAIAAVLCAAATPAQEKQVTATLVKYDGLKQEILKQRGKVVVVDFWATFCPPCMKAFPKFIEMQKEHAARGLVVISVAMDDSKDEDAVKRANKFLTRQDSPLRNLLLDEPSTIWKEKFGITSLPCYFIFDRQGKWVRFRAEDSETGVNYDELKKVVVQMLNEK
ncbi:MAG: TlpA family protein disulfide reductase [Planctomycetes bacterium]|nr:TlpA family protein disulfide reductase [Planctomycetota bacterium]